VTDPRLLERHRPRLGRKARRHAIHGCAHQPRGFRTDLHRYDAS